jgi:hypothetical protein
MIWGRFDSQSRWETLALQSCSNFKTYNIGLDGAMLAKLSLLCWAARGNQCSDKNTISPEVMQMLPREHITNTTLFLDLHFPFL